MSGVKGRRLCSRSTCPQPAVATLTYVYADQCVVVGPLATYAEPHSYDLCDRHAERLSAPRGWEVLRLRNSVDEEQRSADDLVALAEAVREAARPEVFDEPVGETVEVSRRGHLRMLRSTDA